MRVLRGGSSNSQFEVALHNQTNKLRSVNCLAHGAPWSIYALRIFACQIIHRLRHLAGSAVSECFLFDQYYIFIILNMI
jgi:hypothetical protein